MTVPAAGRFSVTSVPIKGYFPRMRRIPLQAAVMAIIVALGAIFLLGRVTGDLVGASDGVKVLRVIDGDTIVVASGGGSETIRLLGIDTPETHHPTKPVGCWGPEAAAFTRGQLNGRLVTLEDDIERIDRYGRHLAYVHINGERFNDRLLREGYARLLTIAPNGVYRRVMLEEEMAAQRAKKGLWGNC